MMEISLGTAVTRLERAIARLERVPPRPDAGVDGNAALVQLEARHDRLRVRVQETVARLDALIAEREAQS